jgi:ABC-type nitrate/sulfonate/bicarbonate transport system substrate-binding protein
MTRRITVVVLVAVLAVGAAACGSDEGESAQGGSAKELPTLKTGTGNADQFSAVTYAGVLTGAFEKGGVDVTITPGGTTGFEQGLLTGQLDLAIGSSVQAIAFTAQGRSDTIVYHYTSGRVGGFVYAPTSKDISEINDCRKVVTGPANTSQWGYAQAYKAELGLDYEITPADPSVAASGLKAGTFDCGIGNGSTYEPLVASGDARVILDGATQEHVHPPVVGAIHGLTDNLEEKRDAVVKYLKVYDQVWKTTFKSGDYDAKEIAELLLESPDYKAYSLEDLTGIMEAARPFLVPDDGFIHEKDWKPTLTFLREYVGNKNVDPNAANLQYDQMIDMSYYNEALGKG